VVSHGAALNVLDLFSGIGGFSLGLERAGFRTVAFCEIDPYCRAVLARHWPHVDCYHDVTQLDAAELARRHGPIDVICGGFPCQDLSQAGKNAGITGPRSGLWFHFARLIRDLGPRFVVVENVSVLRSRGLSVVLGHLATIGYDAEWHCIPAAHLGAPHRRDRIWIIAYPNVRGRQERHGPEALANANGRRWQGRGQPQHGGVESPSRDLFDGCGETRWRHGENLGDPDTAGLPERFTEESNGADRILERESSLGAGWWAVEPDVGRVAHGVPARVDRLKALGNSIVPQIAEMIGLAILEMQCAP